MRDEKEAWRSFVQSGSVMDYLEYKAIQHRHGEAEEAPQDEIQDQGTDRQTTEYR